MNPEYVEAWNNEGRAFWQHRASLSYIDCISIGYCLNNNTEFHTTEKTLKQIKDNTLDKLKVKKYRF